MANIAEGFDCGSDREFVKFRGYSMRSASELQSHLYVGLDQEYLSRESFSRLYMRSTKVKNLIGGFIRYLRSGEGSWLSNLGQRTSDFGPRTRRPRRLASSSP